MLNYDNVCKRLDELMVELLNKGFNIPEHLFGDLNAGRRLVNVLRMNTDPSEPDLAMESSPYLQTVEMNLLTIAEEGLGKDFAETWQKKIIEAYQTHDSDVGKSATYISGIPKTDHWVRLKTSEITADSELYEQIENLNLGFKPQDGGYLLIHGGKEDVKAFIKEIRQKEGRAQQHE